MRETISSLSLPLNATCAVQHLRDEPFDIGEVLVQDGKDSSIVDLPIGVNDQVPGLRHLCAAFGEVPLQHALAAQEQEAVPVAVWYLLERSWRSTWLQMEIAPSIATISRYLAASRTYGFERNSASPRRTIRSRSRRVCRTSPHHRFSRSTSTILQ